MTLSFENFIAVGLFAWMIMSMVLIGLEIW